MTRTIEDLARAVRYQDLEGVAEIIDSGVDVNAIVPNTHGDSVIFIAVTMNNPELVRLLVAKGADIHQQNTNNLTPIHYAAYDKSADMLEVLKDLGANLDIVDGRGITATGHAAANNQPKAIAALARLGADLEKSQHAIGLPIYIAAQHGHVEAINALVASGANPNKPSKNYQKTAACIAAEMGHLDALRALHAAGADLNAGDEFGETPAHIAIRKGNATLLKTLIDLEVDLNVRDKDGFTPLHHAATKEKIEMINLLADAGADIDASAKQGYEQSPLHFAAVGGKTASIQCLAVRGADIEKTDKNGNTATHAAARHGQIESIKLLAALRADLEATNEWGQTPADVARNNKKTEALELLEELAQHAKPEPSSKRTLDETRTATVDPSEISVAFNVGQIMATEMPATARISTGEVFETQTSTEATQEKAPVDATHIRPVSVSDQLHLVRMALYCLTGVKTPIQPQTAHECDGLVAACEDTRDYTLEECKALASIYKSLNFMSAFLDICEEIEKSPQNDALEQADKLAFKAKLQEACHEQRRWRDFSGHNNVHSGRHHAHR
jgi:ankyrin repeat protein